MKYVRLFVGIESCCWKVRNHHWRCYAKIVIALARGKKEHDKRETLKKRESDREMRRYKR